jgi:hypothetical protein
VFEEAKVQKGRKIINSGVISPVKEESPGYPNDLHVN